MPTDGRDPWRILVVANETCPGRRLRDELRSRAAGREPEVLIVCPVQASRLRHLVSDVGPARTAAEERLEASLAALAAFGLRGRGHIGDEDPVLAIEDALFTFRADEIVISTHPPGRSHWLERGVVDRARERFDQPITHLVVDLEAERAEAPPSGVPV